MNRQNGCAGASAAGCSQRPGIVDCHATGDDAADFDRLVVEIDARRHRIGLKPVDQRLPLAGKTARLEVECGDGYEQQNQRDAER